MALIAPFLIYPERGYNCKIHPDKTARKPGPLGPGGSAAPVFKVENKINIEQTLCL